MNHPSAPPVLFDSHMHTPFCRHAHGEPAAYAQRGLERGLKGVVFTCHSPMPDGWYGDVRMRPYEFESYVHAVEAARQAMAGRLEVRLGLESDYFPGMEDWLAELHGLADFHFIHGSVHYFGPEYGERFGTDNEDEFVSTYFELVGDAAESGLFDCLAHPDLIKNHRPNQWSVTRHLPAIERCLDRVAATGVAMELNTSGTLKAVREMCPGPEMLRMMRDRRIPVVLGSDSHTAGRVADQFEQALVQLADAGYRFVSQFERRERFEVDIADALASLRKPAPRMAALAASAA